MASRREPSREQMQKMKRVDLQKLAKDYQVKANIKTGELIDEILRVRAAQALSRASPRRERSSGQLHLAEQENLPEPKAADGPHVSPERVRKAREVQARLGAGRPKIAGGDGVRKTTSVKAVIPPGVRAVHPAGSKGKSKIPTRKVLPKDKRGDTDNSLALVKTSSVEDITEPEDHDTDAVMKTPRQSGETLPSLDSSGQISSYTGSALVTTLDRRVKSLESDNEQTIREVNVLQHELRDARDIISELTRQNEELKMQLETLRPVEKDITEIFERLSLLETRSRKDTDRVRAASISSSEADLATPPMRKMELRTPPDQIGRRSRVGTLRPAFEPHAKGGRSQRLTPLPHLVDPRRQINPDESPSPTRPRLESLLSYPIGEPSGVSSDVHARNSAYPAPRLASTEGTGSGHTSIGSKKHLKYEDVNFSLTGGDSDNERPVVRRGKMVDNGVPEPAFVPQHSIAESSPSLPHPLISSPAQLATVSASSPVAMRPRRSTKVSRRNHPYARKQPERDRSESPDPISSPQTQPAMSIRDYFGTTPDPTRLPPLPTVHAKIPVLNLSGRRSSSTSRISQETPQPSPVRPSSITQQTPPASRTLYGTEFGSAMRAKFSDNEPSGAWRSR